MMDDNFTSTELLQLNARNRIEASSNCSYVWKDHSTEAIGIYLMIIITLLICLLGFWGNGTVIWLLCFRIKRSLITTYILNLSTADFGVVAAVTAIDLYWLVAKAESIEYSDPLKSVFRTFFLFTYSTSQFLLTVISIDRCVCVFFPLWHRFHRPPYLPTTVCAVIWILTFLIFSAHITLFLHYRYCKLWYYQFLLNIVLFTPGMFVSTLAMVIKFYLLSSQQKRGKLFTAILLALLFFLLFALPMNIIQYLSLDIPHFDNIYLYEYAYICASLNSTVNPLIYFLVGREKMFRSRETIKITFEKIFKEEEDCAVGLEPTISTQM